MKCLWRGKLTICTQTNLASVYQTGDHLTSAIDAPNKALKACHKQYCWLMASEGLKPLCIRNGLRMKFGIRSEEMPALSTVQNFVNNYMKTSLDSHDRVDDITEMVRAKIDPSWTNDDNEPVTFTWNYDMDGNAIPGNGTDQVPFIVGVTTKGLLRRLDRAPQSFIFRSDATYKLSKKGYSVLVIGISDCCRTFHLVAFCIISQVTGNVYTAALAAFNRLYVTVIGKRVQLANVMGDADDGQRVKAIPDVTAATIRCDIYNMHFSTSK
ncbi:hypothetical protein PF004_g28035 [Phytophthora fragariae]|uniref:MULE transposase domain-containing protein n=1 Tax=Phytophthora fragariae TaxID=53985 RepID=A0A6G0MJS9_9STRA|nr:hypothetical protein PF004_g28035 [Phytophthora fragariae]